MQQGAPGMDETQEIKTEFDHDTLHGNAQPSMITQRAYTLLSACAEGLARQPSAWKHRSGRSY